MKPIAYPYIAALVRYSSVRSATRLNEIGQKNTAQFTNTLTEFLAYFCTIACNQVVVHRKVHTQDAVANTYSALTEAILAPQKSIEGLDQLKVDRYCSLMIWDTISNPELNFDSYFWSYWNGNLASLGISQVVIEEVIKKGVLKPAEGDIAAAAFALLVRTCRYENAASELPPTVIFFAYDKIIREEVGAFLGVLKAMLQ